jgi:hypothetical protein
MKSTKIAASALVAAAAATIASPADATVYERLRAVDEPYSFVNEDCEGATYLVDGVFNGRFILWQGTGPATEAFPYLDRFSIVETWTNTETGGWFTLSRHGIGHEVKARPVEGTVFEFRLVETGRTIIESSDGNRVATDRGARVITFEFDTLGDGQPGGNYDFDTWVEDDRGPHEIADLCVLAAELTT